MFFAKRNILFDAPGFNLVICPRLTTLFSFFSSFEGGVFDGSVILLLVNGRFLLFHPQLHGHLPLPIICSRLFFVFPTARASLSRNATFPTCTVGLSHTLVVSLIDYAASFLFLKSKNQGHVSQGAVHVSLFVPRPFDATNEPRLAMSHDLSSIAGSNEHEYAYHPASTIFQHE